MSASSGISEDELHAFIDGQLDGPHREAILRLLAEAPEDAARGEIWRGQNEALRAAFARIENEPVPLSLTLAADIPPLATPLLAKYVPLPFKRLGQTLPAPVAFLLGGLLVLVIGCLVNFFVHGIGIGSASTEKELFGGTSEWTAFLTRAQVGLVSVAAQTSGVETSKNPAALLHDEAGLLLPHLNEDGLGPAGVKFLPSPSGALACLVYGKVHNSRIVLCAEELGGRETPGEQDEGEVKEGPTTIIYWRQRNARYGLLGSLPLPVLRRLADQARGEIASFAEH
ncbi:anti-sigma factor family protein [Beijerinckia indica]|uniref:Putative transmembrane anti-sigma factor n=1 Tax=Beijerinckia indica subsp. indica (strain ATCC 9039 / DSM 1715 / NCIMB 8712) TaxID=395963 RepID=B2IIQ4_BEII9|nr:putative transmembrane anti-sigma factor [Beijerinckia indica]ACB94747.1 putative transmembrane anti-sigma factor [Beijerinckia indica subsp. indica ATCC 9039]